MKKIELLMPAGDLMRLKTALLYGADAVFIGGKLFSLRAKASNFSLEDIAEGVQFAHARNKKVYVTVNIIPHCGDLNQIEDYLKALDSIGVDAIIVSSLYIIELVHRLKLHLECHVSTQVSIYNSKSAQFYESLGCTRVVLSRECSFSQVNKIHDKTPLELEVFIQGGLCSSYSGKCTLSNYFVTRDANRGGCAHSCRWDYDLYDGETKINQENHFKIASKDLMGIEHVPELIKMGVASLKVEGRMKSMNYIAIVASVYRKIIDACYQNNLTEDMLEEAKNALLQIESRPLCSGFLNNKNLEELQIYGNDGSNVNQTFLGYIKHYDINAGEVNFVRKNDIKDGEIVEVYCYDQEPFLLQIKNLRDEDGPLSIANNTSKELYFTSEIELKPLYFLRKKK